MIFAASARAESSLASRSALAGGDHVRFEASRLELDTLALELLLGDDPCLLAGDHGLCLGGAGERLQLRLAHTQGVLLLDDLQVGLRGGDLSALAGLRLGLLGLGGALGLGDPGLLQHLGGLATPDRVQVADLVGHVLDLHHVELETERLDVVVGLVDQRLGELEPVLVDLFGSQGRQHAAQVRLERLLRDRGDLGPAERRGSARRSSAAAPRHSRPSRWRCPARSVGSRRGRRRSGPRPRSGWC